MDTIRHTARAVSGHYGIPTPVTNMQTKHSFSLAPPSTIRGYIESLMGLSRGEFEGEIAFGVMAPPVGFGKVLRMNTAWGNAEGKPDPALGLDANGKPKKTKGESNATLRRPYYWDIYYGMSYQIAVRGPLTERLAAALRGEVERYGILSLGTSEDEVYEVTEEAEEARWVVPGKMFVLPVVSGEGWNKREPLMGRFSLTVDKKVDIPEEAWIKFVRAAPAKKPKKSEAK